ncbi:MAG: hypothetical protein HDQ97_11805 [Lachnospiraceae bacterium]|nr:hypothetical protein [Lachnospiraceae bacterium]
METRLTKAEVNCFKHGLPGDRKILNALSAVFWFSWGACMLWLSNNLFSELGNDKKVDTGKIELLLMLSGLAIIFIVCMKCINKRNERIYQSLKNGEYRLVVSTITAKDFRYQGSGKSRYMVDFYKCAEINGEITPVSKKQFRHAQIGDRIKVIMIDKVHVIYGIVERKK